MTTANLSPKSAVAVSQILAIEEKVAKIGEENVVVQCHEIVSALSDAERAEVASTVRDCAIRAQRCAVNVLRDKCLLALGLAVGGAKLTNSAAVALYQQHVERQDLPEWIRAIIRTKLDTAKTAIAEAQKKVNEPPAQKKTTVVAKPVVTASQPVAVKPVSAPVVVEVVPVVEEPKPKCLREQIEDLLKEIKNGKWRFREVYTLLDGAPENKRKKPGVGAVVAEIEAERPACFAKVRDAVAKELKKAGYPDASTAVMDDDFEDGEQALSLILKSRAPGVPSWVFGPVHYRLGVVRELAQKRKLAEVDKIAEKLAKLVGGIQAAVEQAEQVPDLIESLLGEAEQMFDEADQLFCEFWALEALIDAGGTDTFVGWKITDDREFGAKVLAKPAKQKAQEFRKLLLDEGLEALQGLRALVDAQPKVTVSRHDGVHGRERFKMRGFMKPHQDSPRRPRRDRVAS